MQNRWNIPKPWPNSELPLNLCQRAWPGWTPFSIFIHLSDLPSDLLQRVIRGLIVEPHKSLDRSAIVLKDLDRIVKPFTLWNKGNCTWLKPNGNLHCVLRFLSLACVILKTRFPLAWSHLSCWVQRLSEGHWLVFEG